MRRIFVVLALAVIAWIVLRSEAAQTSGGNSAAGSDAARSVQPSVASSRAPRNAGVATGSAASASNGAAQTASANSGKGFRDRAHLHDHFAKHGGEFSGVSEAQYLSLAQTLRDAAVGGEILEITRANDGVVSRFDTRTGAFLAFDRDGTIRTFFKPNDGVKYFRRQANRAPTP